MKISAKRTSALFLSLLLLLTMIPQSVIALAADEAADEYNGAPLTLSISQEIVTFEQSNPVAEISYQTGASVLISDFPASISAVVALSAPVQTFIQSRPESTGNYIAPDGSDALYEAGETVVYTLPSESGEQYRVYGEVDGVTGWFSCDADGVINGIVRDVPVEWDTTVVHTEAAGTFHVDGRVDGYTVSCQPPEVTVTVHAKSGDQNIAVHSLTWLSGTSQTAIDENALSITPDNNGTARVVCQVEFSVGGEENISAGQIEIRLPAHLFFDRNGQPVGTVTVPLAEAPEESGSTGFHYMIDPDTDEIVIKNYRTIESSYYFTCQIGYDFLPYQVADGYTTDDLRADFKVTTPSQKALTAASETLSAAVHTSVKTPKFDKSFNQKYETWQAAWGEAPADAADYFYVEWKLDATIPRGTQPFTVTFQEDTGLYGTLVGWKFAGKSYTLGSETEFERTVFLDESPRTLTTYPDTSVTVFVLMQYPRSMLADTLQIRNVCDINLNGYDGDNRTETDEGTYHYIPPNIEYAGDICKATKTDGFDLYGGINMLETGKSAGSYFSISVQARGYGMTENGTVPYTTVLDDSLLLIEDDLLSPEDISFTEFYIWKFDEYDFVIDEETGYQPVRNSDYTQYQPIRLLVRTTEAPEQWVEWGEITRETDGSYWWEGEDGSSAAISSAAPISLPDGTYDVRFCHTGTVYQVEFGAYLYFELHPTEHVMQLIDGKDGFSLFNMDSAFAVDHDNVIRTPPSGFTWDSQKSAIARASDLARYGQRVSHDTNRVTYSRLRPYASCSKSFSKPQSDFSNSQESLTYTIKYFEYVEYSSPLTRQDVIDLGVIQEQRDGIFYDLLPVGTTVDAASITAKTYSDSWRGEKKCEYTVESIENWQGSGRTMLKIHVIAPPGTENFDTQNAYGELRTGFVVTFKLINSWENIQDYGASVLNSAAYYSLSGQLVGGYPDNGGNLTEKELFYDLDADGNPPDAWKNVHYAECRTTFTPLTAAELGFRKSVKAADGLRYGSSAEVAAAGTYTYQLRFANGKNVETNNVVLFDVLESAHGSNPYWRGTLKDIDTTQVSRKGIEPVIYYSTYTAFTNLAVDTDLTDLTDETIWTTTQPVDLADVTAIAIDLRYRTDGTEYTFAPEEVALCYVSMTAPENYQDYLDDPETAMDETAFAYNSAYLQSTATLIDGGESKTAMEECSSVTVSLRGPEAEIHKSSDPQTGTAENPAAVSAGETITYHISAANTGTVEAIYAVEIEDLLPEGLVVDPDTIQCSFGTSISEPMPISGSPRVQVRIDGRKLTFSVDKLDAGETIHLLIPVTVSEALEDTVFENTALLSKFNEKFWNLESETTWHKVESEYGYELPNTGGIGVVPLFALGVIMAIFSLFVHLTRRFKTN